MTDRVLFVDDDANLLAGMRRQYRNDFAIETAGHAEDGLRILREKGPFAVVVSDLRMPGMSGSEFLKKVGETHPDTVRILLTGFADLSTAIDAVNYGHVFRFLTKPCPPETVKSAVTAGFAQHRLVADQKDLLEKTLRGTIKVLSDILSLTNPRAFGKTGRIRKLVGGLVQVMNIPDPWKIDVGAMLALVGFVAIPEQILGKMDTGQRLTLDEDAVVQQYPKVGYEMLAGIPRLEEVAEIVRYQQRRYDGWDDTGLTLSGRAIPLGARLLKVALDYDAAVQRGLGPRAAYTELDNKARFYDPNALTALKDLIARDQPGDVVKIKLRELKAGMLLVDGLFNKYGARLIAENSEVTPVLLMRIQNMGERGMIVEPFNVIRPLPLAQELAEAAQEAAAQAPAEVESAAVGAAG